MKTEPVVHSAHDELCREMYCQQMSRSSQAFTYVSNEQIGIITLEYTKKKEKNKVRQSYNNRKPVIFRATALVAAARGGHTPAVSALEG